MTSFETRDIFKPSGLNGDSFVDEVEAKCDISNSISQQQQELSGNGAPYSNGALHSSYVFTKPTLDLESMGMAYGVSGLYLQGNGVTGSGPSVSQAGLMSPSMVASEKLNGLTLEQIAPSYCPPTSFDMKTTASLGFAPGMIYPSARAVSVNTGTKPFMSSPQTSPVAQVVTSQAPPAKGMTRFGSQEMLMAAAAAAAESNGMSSMNDNSTSPLLSPSSSDGKENVEGLVASENGMKMSHEKQYFQGLLRQESGVDTADFVDQVYFVFFFVFFVVFLLLHIICVVFAFEILYCCWPPGDSRTRRPCEVPLLCRLC